MYVFWNEEKRKVRNQFGGRGSDWYMNTLKCFEDALNYTNP